MKEHENKELLYVPIFAGLNVSDEEKFRVYEEMKKLGGISFSTINKSEEGWYAQCDQIDGLIVGNTNPRPTDPEVQAEMRQGILSAFNVKIEEPSAKTVSFEYASLIASN